MASPVVRYEFLSRCAEELRLKDRLLNPCFRERTVFEAPYAASVVERIKAVRYRLGDTKDGAPFVRIAGKDLGDAERAVRLPRHEKACKLRREACCAVIHALPLVIGFELDLIPTSWYVSLHERPPRQRRP